MTRETKEALQRLLDALHDPLISPLIADNGLRSVESLCDQVCVLINQRCTFQLGVNSFDRMEIQVPGERHRLVADATVVKRLLDAFALWTNFNWEIQTKGKNPRCVVCNGVHGGKEFIHYNYCLVPHMVAALKAQGLQNDSTS